MKAKDLWNPVQRYSIRKYSIGVTSIALGTVLLGAGSTVAADQLSVETPQLAPQSELVENHSVPSLGDVVYAAPAQPQAISVSLTADQLQEFPEHPAQDLPASGAYTFAETVGVKNELSKDADVAFYLQAGDQVHYDQLHNQEGYQWLSYKSYSGQRRYAPIGVQTAPAVAPQPEKELEPALPTSGTFQFDGRYGIKKEARVASPDVAYYDKGSSVNYDKVVESDGYRWLSYLSYSDNRHYIALEKLASAPKVEAKPVVKEAAKVETKPVVKENAKVEASGLAASGNFRFDGRYGIKKEARVASPDVAYYDKGSSVNYDKVVESDGYRWLSYLSYSGNRHYIALEKLASAPKVEAKPVVKEAAKVAVSGLPASGSYVFRADALVKNQPQAAAEAVALYEKGMSVNYDRLIQAEGRNWLSYISASGVRRYVALPF
ncbi:YSIRK-type signal peptide-containing protein [Streptococcus danieliae]|uniref:YSIRK-type signal peptide-containing protein n=1 Tax=Streptococcus danieliae TaxID=747656 RepID=A0A7X3G7H6_9STRE|nr:SH3 domain-containing protein [Streptococcus danieliae]MVX58337.1 YSIRK-type signal peptide-containing protein [Streptococcus danieliae]